MMSRLVTKNKRVRNYMLDSMKLTYVDLLEDKVWDISNHVDP